MVARRICTSMSRRSRRRQQFALGPGGRARRPRPAHRQPDVACRAIARRRLCGPGTGQAARLHRPQRPATGRREIRPARCTSDESARRCGGNRSPIRAPRARLVTQTLSRATQRRRSRHCARHGLRRAGCRARGNFHPARRRVVTDRPGRLAIETDARRRAVAGHDRKLSRRLAGDDRRAGRAGCAGQRGFSGLSLIRQASTWCGLTSTLTASAWGHGCPPVA